MRLNRPLISAVIVFIASSVHSAVPVMIEEDGMIVFEVESHPPVSGWEKKTELDGYTGACYYLSTGGGQMSWRLFIIRGGKYRLYLRNRHDHPDHTLENDCFTKMDDGPSWKTYSSKRGQWTWHTKHEPPQNRHLDPIYHLSPGIHTFTISGRSAGFMIDRVHFARIDISKKKAEDATLAPTPGYPPPPDLDQLPSVKQAWANGKLGQAWKLAEKELAGSAAAQAGQAIAELKAHAANQFEQCTELKAGDPVAAVSLLEVTAEQFTGCSRKTELLATLRKWKADPAYRKFQKAQQIYNKVLAARMKIQGNGTITDSQFANRNQPHLSMIYSGYKRLKSGYADTSLFEKAKLMIVELGFKE